MQQRIFSPENPKGVVEVYTAEQEAEVKATSEKGKAQVQAERDAMAQNEIIKASAKAKLMAGEPMTEEEANLTLHI